MENSLFYLQHALLFYLLLCQAFTAGLLSANVTHRGCRQTEPTSAGPREEGTHWGQARWKFWVTGLTAPQGRDSGEGASGAPLGGVGGRG